jgi:glyoxylase-like metal-dependent hydrolase (beta-lactamase superfamily II)
MEIVEGIHWVEGINGNVYIIIEGEDLTLVDTGLPNNAGKILDYIQKINRRPSEVSKILLTHCHIDHVGSAHELVRLTRAKVSVHQEDAESVAGRRPLPVPKGIISVPYKAFSRVVKYTPVQPDIILKEGDRVGSFTVMHTPGHTPGSISLYDPSRKLLFAGDTIRFSDGKITCPPEQFTWDMAHAVRSIERISQLDFDVMLSGHGEPLRPNASVRVKEFYASLR